MLGPIVNGLAIIAGGLIGLLLRKGIKESYKETVMQGLGLAVIVIGLSTALKSADLLVVIGAMAIGSVLGEWWNIQGGLEHVGDLMERRLGKAGQGFTKGFVTASVIYCSGAMAILGAMESGLTGTHSTLFTKSILDGVSAIVFASSLGIGVIASAIPVTLYEGLIALASMGVKDILTEVAIADMSAVGGMIIMGIGLNVMGVTKIRVANMIPAIFLPLLYYGLLSLF